MSVINDARKFKFDFSAITMSPWRESHSRKQFPFFIWLNGFEITLFIWFMLRPQCKPQYAKTFLSINH